MFLNRLKLGVVLMLIRVVIAFIFFTGSSNSTVSKVLPNPEVVGFRFVDAERSQFMELNSKHTGTIQKDEARILFENFFTELFRNRNPLRAFERYAAFDSWDKLDQEFIGQESFFAALPLKVGGDLDVRIKAYAWQYEFGEMYLELGLQRLETQREPLIDEEYRSIVKRSLEQSHVNYPDFDFYGLRGDDIVKRLEEFEAYFKVFNAILSEKIETGIYAANMALLKKSVRIKKEVFRGRTYFIFSVSETNPSLFFVATSKLGQLKIIHIGDDV